MTQKITAIFGTFIFAAILMGTLALAPNAYAGISPLAVPPSITTSLLPGELGQFLTTIDPQLQLFPLGFTANFDSVNPDTDCGNFLGNLAAGPINIGPTEFDWQWNIEPFLFAVPGVYTCTAIWVVEYTDPAGNVAFREVGQLLTVTVTTGVEIDIKPGSDPNSINPRSMGVVPVAILGSDSLDVLDVDVTTLSFGPGGATPVHEEDGAVPDDHYEDVNDDGFIDLVTHYVQKDAEPSAPEACLTGALNDGTLIEGCDSVRTPGNN